MRFGRVAAQHRQGHFCPWLAGEQPHALIHRGVAGGLPIDGADVVARSQTGSRGRRAVPRGDDPQVVLARQFDTGLTSAAQVLLLEGLGLFDVEVRAIRIETVGQTVHRAVHHLVDLHFFHVVVDDQLHHVVEDAQV